MMVRWFQSLVYRYQCVWYRPSSRSWVGNNWVYPYRTFFCRGLSGYPSGCRLLAICFVSRSCFHHLLGFSWVPITFLLSCSMLEYFWKQNRFPRCTLARLYSFVILAWQYTLNIGGRERRMIRCDLTAGSKTQSSTSSWSRCSERPSISASEDPIPTPGWESWIGSHAYKICGMVHRSTYLRFPEAWYCMMFAVNEIHMAIGRCTSLYLEI